MSLTHVCSVLTLSYLMSLISTPNPGRWDLFISEPGLRSLNHTAAARYPQSAPPALQTPPRQLTIRIRTDHTALSFTLTSDQPGSPGRGDRRGAAKYAPQRGATTNCQSV